MAGHNHDRVTDPKIKFKACSLDRVYLKHNVDYEVNRYRKNVDIQSTAGMF